MAKYDIECKTCGILETEVPMTGASHLPCPKCGKKAKKLIGQMAGFKMPVESPLAHQEWFASDAVQKGLRDGTYRQVGKHEDQAHGI